MIQSIYPRIVIFGGPGRTGESTLAKRFARENGFELISGGNYMRTIAMADGFVRDNYQIPTDRTLWDLDYADPKLHRIHAVKVGRDIDFETDMALVKRMLEVVWHPEGAPLVIESKSLARLLFSETFNELIVIALYAIQHPEIELLAVLTSYQRGEITAQEFKNDITHQRELLIQNTKAVWIDADLSARALRSLQKLSKVSASVEFIPDAAAIASEVANLTARQQGDADAYSRVYGFDDYPLPGAKPVNEKYGIVIGNSHQSLDESYAAVCQALKQV